MITFSQLQNKPPKRCVLHLKNHFRSLVVTCAPPPKFLYVADPMGPRAQIWAPDRLVFVPFRFKIYALNLGLWALSQLMTTIGHKKFESVQIGSILHSTLRIVNVT